MRPIRAPAAAAAGTVVGVSCLLEVSLLDEQRRSPAARCAAVGLPTVGGDSEGSCGPGSVDEGVLSEEHVCRGGLCKHLRPFRLECHDLRF